MLLWCSPDNRTGTTNFVDEWVVQARASEFLVLDRETPYLDVLLSTSATQACTAKWALRSAHNLGPAGKLEEMFTASYVCLQHPMCTFHFAARRQEIDAVSTCD